MSRISHAARLERLKRQFRGEPTVTVTWAPWVLALAGEAAGLGRALRPEELLHQLAAAYAPRREPPPPTREAPE